MSDVVLRVQHLSGGYDRHTVLRDLSFELHAGEILALLGPNGAGKTTSLMTISGFLPAIHGEVEVLGHSTHKRSPHALARLGLGYVPDDRALFKSLSVRENLKVAARGSTALELALDYFPELQKRRDVRAGDLSGGEQQMLVIARALLTRPKVLLIDEMSAGLAPVIVTRLMSAVRKLADNGLAVLLVEQFAALALSIGNRAYVMRRGRVVHDGDCLKLLKSPDELHRLYLGG
jgi:branched-chain amino acid transport system ATP-binding protein